MIEIRNLEVWFGATRVVDLAELDVHRGEVVGLVGESGSGKSTVGYSLLGLGPRDGARYTGSIRLDGVELVGAPESRIRRLRGQQIGMIFQSPAAAFSPVMKLRVMMHRTLRLHGLRARADRESRIADSLEAVRLPVRILDRYPHQVSGGQLQRVAIALILALHVHYLVADEPTSALDATVQAEILALLRRLCKDRDLGVLLISHDLPAVANVADRVAVMKDGSLVDYGPTKNVVMAPSADYTRELLNAVISMEGRQ